MIKVSEDVLCQVLIGIVPLLYTVYLLLSLLK